METAFLMICKPLFDRCLCVFVCVCVSLGAATCLARDWLFVVGVTSKTKKVCVRELCVNFNCLLHALVLIQHLVLQQSCHGTQGPLCTVHLLLAAIQTS